MPDDDAFSVELTADITPTVVHPPGVLLDEDGHPRLDEHGEPIYREDPQS